MIVIIPWIGRCTQHSPMGKWLASGLRIVCRSWSAAPVTTTRLFFLVGGTLLLLSSCSAPTAPETRCFTSPYLYCSQLADGDGE